MKGKLKFELQLLEDSPQKRVVDGTEKTHQHHQMFSPIIFMYVLFVSAAFCQNLCYGNVKKDLLVVD